MTELMVTKNPESGALNDALDKFMQATTHEFMSYTLIASKSGSFKDDLETFAYFCKVGSDDEKGIDKLVNDWNAELEKVGGGFMCIKTPINYGLIVQAVNGNVYQDSIKMIDELRDIAAKRDTATVK